MTSSGNHPQLPPVYRSLFHQISQQSFLGTVCGQFQVGTGQGQSEWMWSISVQVDTGAVGRKIQRQIAALGQDRQPKPPLELPGQLVAMGDIQHHPPYHWR